VALTVKDGFLVICDLSIQPQGKPEVQLPLSGEQWDMTQEPVLLQDDGSVSAVSPRYDAGWMREKFLKSWLDLRGQGNGVVVGEFGCFNKTPHAVALAWLEDWLSNWKESDLGWALWNFRGSFGILDSDREDVAYEDFQGHKLDREMLELLKKY
jgi:endoglucanase